LLGAQQTLFGIVTKPAAEEPRRRAVILLNAGPLTTSARVACTSRLRDAGPVAGTSCCAWIWPAWVTADAAGEPDDEVFPPAALEDVRTALDFLRQRYQVRDFAVGGRARPPTMRCALR